MNDAQIDRRRNARGSKTLKVAPVTRAIRAALAASATMLALSGTALAQDSCNNAAPRSLSCARDLASHADASLLVAPADLTRVVDEQLPVSALGADAWNRYAAIDARSIATQGVNNSLVVGSYAGAVPYADLTELDIVGAVSADETIVGADATAYGAVVYGGAGVGLLINDGSITTSASSDIGTALAVGGAVFSEVATAINDTTIVVDAFTDTGSAVALGLEAYGSNAAAYNYGDITVNATATGAGGMASAYGLYSTGSSSVADNQGDITVVANGVGRATAVGVYSTAGAYSVIRNSANVTATAIATGDGSFAAAAGLQGTSASWYGTADVHNSGDVIATAEAHGNGSVAAAYGALATSGPYGSVDVQNDGSLTANASVVDADTSLVNAFGIYAWTYGGAVSVANNGDIVATGQSQNTGYGTIYAFGIYAFAGATYYATTAVTNTGDISVDATGNDGKAMAYGVHQLAAIGSTTNAADAGIHVTADSTYSGVSGAIGVWNLGLRQSTVNNDGDISAYSHASGSFYYSYAGTRAMGVYAGSSPYGTASVVNNGDISAVAVSENASRFFGGSSGATGIMVYADNADVQNTNDIVASAWTNAGVAGSYGVLVHGKYSSNIANAGNITAYAYAGSLAGDTYAGRTAVRATEIFGTKYATETNSGSIHATAISADAYGHAYGPAIAEATGAYIHANRTATLTNSGDITAYARADGGHAEAYGVDMQGRRAGTVTNTKDITAVAHADGGSASAVGVYNLSVYGYTQGVSLLDNSGTIRAGAYADDGIALSYGAVLIGQGGTYADNSGTITAVADGGAAVAYGLLARSLLGSAYVQNTGTGTAAAVATSTAGDASAMGIFASGDQVTTLLTDGTVYAGADATGGNAIAYGAYVSGGGAGNGLLINGGDIDAVAIADGGFAHAYGAVVASDVATAINDNHVGAHAQATNGDALSFAMQAYGNNAAAYNYGDLVATALSNGGNAAAMGINSQGYLTSVTYNGGDITAAAQATGDATATGLYSMATYTSAYATNIGSILAQANGEDAIANGLVNVSLYIGDALVTNDGSINASANGLATATAVGAYTFAYAYDATLTNHGDITASAHAEGNPAAAQYATAIGVQSVNHFGWGYGDASVVNDATISVLGWVEYGIGNGLGAIAVAGPYSTASIQNTGTIYGNVHADKGLAATYGAYVHSVAGLAQVVNQGDIIVTASVDNSDVDLPITQFAGATGIKAISSYFYYGGRADVTNNGDIYAHAVVGGGLNYSFGVYEAGASAALTNTGHIDVVAQAGWGMVRAYGAFIYAYDATVVNDGAINAYGISHSVSDGSHIGVSRVEGIKALALHGAISVTNNGDINAVSKAYDIPNWGNGGGLAIGIDLYGDSDVVVENNGDVLALTAIGGGPAGATGAVIGGGAYGHMVNGSDALISAIASTATMANDAYGGYANAAGVDMFFDEIAVVENDGTIFASATVDPGTGIAQTPGSATAWGTLAGFAYVSAYVANHGDIQAVATADYGYASAYGSSLKSGGDTSALNTGSMLAVAHADHGNAWAVGSYGLGYHRTYTCGAASCYFTVDGGTAALDNQGDLFAQATAAGGIATAYGAVAIGVLTAGVSNAGHITSIAQGDDAKSTGVVANSMLGTSTLQNDGTIAASATGTTSAEAIGALLIDQGDIQVGNTGSIVAGAYGPSASATALQLESTGANVVTNSGTIAAFGDGERVAIDSNIDASATVANTGTIIGAIRTGDLSDSLHNASGASWLAVGDSSFGGGDDGIANAGTLVMQDATIDLGGYTTGNAFGNTGSLFALGHDTLDMGGAFAARNDGTISFLDGAADDTLTIVGDLAGEGILTLDVSGTHGHGDLLYVTGNVADGSTQAIDVDLLDLPSAPSVRVPLVYVEGDSSSPQFVLGNVRYRQDDFVTLDFSLGSDIDTSNAARDTFYLGVDVTGLNDQGAIATALAPGVARLMDAQIGTWRQRMGVVPVQSSKSGLAPWVRYFSDSGNVAPGHVENFGAGGNFGFSQSNHGWEVGLDTRPANHVAVGVLLSKTDGSQHLDDASGRTHLTGTGFGVYLTWMGDQGAYVDGSMRWTGVDAKLDAATASHKTEGEADTVNIEAGLSPWTVGGIGIQPQLQYTNTHIGDFKALRGATATFVEQGGRSERGRLGVAFSKTFEASNGVVLTPYGSINAVHEFDGEYSYSINNGALSGSTQLDGTSAMVELGLGAQKAQWSLSGGINWTDGAALDGLFGGQLNVRYSW